MHQRIVGQILHDLPATNQTYKLIFADRCLSWSFMPRQKMLKLQYQENSHRKLQYVGYSKNPWAIWGINYTLQAPHVSKRLQKV